MASAMQCNPLAERMKFQFLTKGLTPVSLGGQGEMARRSSVVTMGVVRKASRSQAADGPVLPPIRYRWATKGDMGYIQDVLWKER